MAALSVLLMAVATAVGTAVPASATITNSMCDFAIVVVLRGTNAPEGSGLMHGGRAWSSGGMGEIAGLRSTLANTDTPYYVEALAFNATGGAPYATVVAQARTVLVNEVNWLNQQCPYSPIVLAGHSMGADIILDALQPGSAGSVNLTAAAKANVDAVAVFGDPTYRSGKPYNVPGNGTSNGAFPRSSTTDLEAMRSWGWPYGATTTMGWVYTIRSWCNVGDFFCQANAGDSDFAIHGNYQGKMAAARDWIEFMLTSWD